MPAGAAAARLLLRHQQEAEARRSTTRRARRSCSPRRAIRTASRSPSHGPNNRYINDDKIAQAIAQFYSRAGIDAKVETMPLERVSSRAPPRASSATCCSAGAPNRASRARAALAARDATTRQGHGRDQPRRATPTRRSTSRSATRWSPMDDKEARGACSQQAAETAMNDTGLIPIHYEVSTWATAQGLQVHAAHRPVHARARTCKYRRRTRSRQRCSPSPSAGSARALFVLVVMSFAGVPRRVRDRQPDRAAGQPAGRRRPSARAPPPPSASTSRSLEQYVDVPRARGCSGDLGRSFVFNVPAIQLILERMPATLELAVRRDGDRDRARHSARAVSPASSPHSIGGRAIMAGSILGFSLPTFWVGLC